MSLADDRGVVVHLLHRYAHAVDDADAAGVAGCFTRDGRFGTRDGTVAVQGRDGLLAFFGEVSRPIPPTGWSGPTPRAWATRCPRARPALAGRDAGHGSGVAVDDRLSVVAW